MLWPQAWPMSGRGVEFCAHGNHQRTASELGHERCRQVGGPGRHVESGLGQHPHALLGGVVLLEGKFGMIPDVVGQGDEIGGLLRHRLLDGRADWLRCAHAATVTQARSGPPSSSPSTLNCSATNALRLRPG